jgi:hypothetical protein
MEGSQSNIAGKYPSTWQSLLSWSLFASMFIGGFTAKYARIVENTLWDTFLTSTWSWRILFDAENALQAAVGHHIQRI